MFNPGGTKKQPDGTNTVRLQIKYKTKRERKYSIKGLSVPDYPFGLFCNSYSSPHKRQLYGFSPYTQEKRRNSFSFGSCPFRCRISLAKTYYLQLLMETAPLYLILHQFYSFYHSFIRLSTGKSQNLLSYFDKIPLKKLLCEYAGK